MYCWSVGKGFSGLLILFLLFSCGRRTPGPEIFSFDSLRENQTKLLAESKASLKKTILVNQEKDEKNLGPVDQTIWEKELDYISLLNEINKPLSGDLYTVVDGKKDKESNLLIKEISANQSAKIAYVRIYYLENLKNIKKIEALVEEKNYLYASQKFIVWEFQHHNGQPLLTRATLNGTQKMVIGDTVQFSINTRVIFP